MCAHLSIIHVTYTVDKFAHLHETKRTLKYNAATRIYIMIERMSYIKRGSRESSKVVSLSFSKL